MSWPTFWSKSPLQSWKTAALWPLGKLVCAVAARRLKKFHRNPPAKPTSAVVVVVGNIVVGGAGKTPFIQWLGRLLNSEGLSYGVVSRGYGGEAKLWPQLVFADSDPKQVGDEPVLLAKSLGCPVAAAPERAEAIRLLNANHDLDVIISDDGLQHYGMARDIEVVVMDAERLLGNELCMPAGPLREPKRRMAMVDYLVWNGGDEEEILTHTSTAMNLTPFRFRSVATPDMELPASIFQGQAVNAMAGIGNPARFYETLAGLGIETDNHDFADHQSYTLEDFKSFQNSKPLLMTEKDAVKCQPFAQANWWYLQVRPQCSQAFADRLMADIRNRLSDLDVSSI